MLSINDYKEVFIFLLILGVWLCFIIFFRLDLTLGLQNIITTSAIIVALGAALLSIIHNKEALKQSEKNLHKQLIYEDRKKALLSVLQILEQQYPNIDDLKSENFPEFFFLPEDTKKLIKSCIEHKDKIISKNSYSNEMANNAEETIKENVTSHLEKL